MALHLYAHPLASFCWKVLIALYEADTAFEQHMVDLADPREHARFLDLWPVGKMPVLRDDAADRVIPETSIIVEYLDRHHRGASPMIPDDPEAALEVRLWDRFFDAYLHLPMQRIVLDRIRPEASRNAADVAEAQATLATAYAMVEARMAGRTWAVGDSFGLADCAAMPALFYAATVHTMPDDATALRAYLDRLIARPSAARVLDEARPWFAHYPFRDRLPESLRPTDA